MARLLRYLIVLMLIGGGAFWFLTSPQRADVNVFADTSGDAKRGEAIFWAGGCASCHAAPGAKDEARLVLAGGYRIVSPFGTFIAPNISPSDEGLAGWSVADLGNALLYGTSPDGRHYYPAFPYSSYQHMKTQDIADLKAFLDTLPSSDTPNTPHELGFPFTIRRGIGLWKLLNMSPNWMLEAADSPELERGRYLVEALAHCGECHTPRNVTGGLDRSRWMAGAPNPSGEGKIPGITPDTLDWNTRDIVFYLETGLDPDYDSAGAQMVSVIANMGHLTIEDRTAIAAYLKALPPSN
ncbi:Cytochrome c, mono-and diheme variants [Nitrosomonas eutropha]|uniref:cytochrome c n=1 Tax=Nitrosomonas eutropha TaxID=916 RepID=UPI0008989BE5|nr:cytochrome c [Nitrosomonas eutropha]SDX12532.1 Cytochrome c, mono-and diheme variants [Nitrosomonas eutropha]